MEPDLSEKKQIHIVGIGGAGMSAIATVAHRLGHTVSGSDLKDSRTLARLSAQGVTTKVGHARANILKGTDFVVISSAIRPDNSEVVEAKARNIPVYSRARMLAAIVELKISIAVAGSHGKTTTSSMLSLILRHAGLAPSFIIGGDLNEVGTNAMLGTGELLVVEADESDGTFLELGVRDAIVTNVESDHLDHHGSFEALCQRFEDFIAGVPGTVVVCGDDPRLKTCSAKHTPTTYGFEGHNDFQIANYVGKNDGSSFSLRHEDEPVGSIELPIPGRHNALNAVGAAALAMSLGVEFAVIAEALARFGGVARRFQLRGEKNGVVFIDDYAHLPGEVAAAISAAQEGGYGRVIAVFQPHRYTRTAALYKEFGAAFRGADKVVLTDIYSAAEDPIPGVTGRLILRSLLEATPGQDVMYLAHRNDIEEIIPRIARAGDLVLTMGAGDLTALPDAWVS